MTWVMILVCVSSVSSSSNQFISKVFLSFYSRHIGAILERNGWRLAKELIEDNAILNVRFRKKFGHKTSKS